MTLYLWLLEILIKTMMEKFKIIEHEFRYILTHVGEKKLTNEELYAFSKECEHKEDDNLEYEEFILLNEIPTFSIKKGFKRIILIRLKRSYIMKKYLLSL